jgi:hypothetical protein
VAWQHPRRAHMLDCRAAGEPGGLLLPARLPAVISPAVRRCLGRARSCANGTFCEPVPAIGRGHFGRSLSALRCALVGSGESCARSCR